MNDVSTSEQVWRTGKISHSRHRHNQKPISMGFDAPSMCEALTFSSIALAASAARTATLRKAPPKMLASWKDSILLEVKCLIEDTSTFTLTQWIDALADAERATFAGRIGAGVTDLLMNVLGYTWRDNAACLSSALAPHADFIYGGGAITDHGVVLAEAHGSFAANVSASTICRKAKSKYGKQVKPYLGKEPLHGKVIHGYSIAFGSKPGAEGAFLHAAETRIPKPRGKRSPSTETTPIVSPETPPISLALATHRANFSLMDAPSIVAWIDYIRSGGKHPDAESPVSFQEISYDGRMFLACIEPVWPFHSPLHWPDDFWHDRRSLFRYRRQRMLRRSGKDFAGWFVMEKNAAECFLNALSTIIRDGGQNLPETLKLPSFEPVGFAIDQDRISPALSKSEYTYALYRDGLALLGSPPLQKIAGCRHRIWSPKKGMLGVIVQETD